LAGVADAIAIRVVLEGIIDHGAIVSPVIDSITVIIWDESVTRHAALSGVWYAIALGIVIETGTGNQVTGCGGERQREQQGCADERNDLLHGGNLPTIRIHSGVV
jgi:hypothetical protein